MSLNVDGRAVMGGQRPAEGLRRGGNAPLLSAHVHTHPPIPPDSAKQEPVPLESGFQHVDTVFTTTRPGRDLSDKLIKKAEAAFRSNYQDH